MSDEIEFEPEFEEDLEFEADDDFEEALGGKFRSHIDMDELRARGREAFETAKTRGRERLYDAGRRGKERLAETIDNTATVLDDRLYGSAEYLRSTDLDVMRDDLIAQVRKRPLLSAGIALGAGYLVGKAMNVGSGKRGRRGKRSSGMKRKIGRAVVSSLATMVVARLRESAMAAVEEPPEPAPSRGRRPRKQ